MAFCCGFFHLQSAFAFSHLVASPVLGGTPVCSACHQLKGVCVVSRFFLVCVMVSEATVNI